MRLTLLTLLTVTALWLDAAVAHAQPPSRPGPDPRAYRHFLLSRSPHKVYSTSMPGTVATVETPFTRHTTYTGTGYFRHRATPRGYEEYRIVPAHGETFEGPFGGYSLHVPGYPLYRYLPRP